jgi:PBP1b-binding outer membrane lipoprotein LpoB
MKNLKQSHLLIILFFSIILAGCNSETKEAELNEKKVAVAFFDAVYNTKDINEIKKLSSESFKKKISQYKTAKHFSRRVLNMQFDSVTMETAAANTQIIDEFNVQVTMTVLFTGQRNGSTFKDYKRIRLVKKDNAWLVDKLLDNS